MAEKTTEITQTEEAKQEESFVSQITEALGEDARRFQLTFEEFVNLYSDNISLTAVPGTEYDSISCDEFEKEEYGDGISVYYTEKFEPNRDDEINQEFGLSVAEMYLKIYVEDATNKIREVEYGVNEEYDAENEEEVKSDVGNIFSCFDRSYYDPSSGIASSNGFPAWDEKNHVLFDVKYEGDKIIWIMKALSVSEEEELSGQKQGEDTGMITDENSEVSEELDRQEALEIVSAKWGATIYDVFFDYDIEVRRNGNVGREYTVTVSGNAALAPALKDSWNAGSAVSCTMVFEVDVESRSCTMEHLTGLSEENLELFTMQSYY